MDSYKYFCENESCKKFNVEISGKEKICPYCGTETLIYKIILKKYIPKWFKLVFLLISISLLGCLLGFVYLQFFSGHPIFTF